MKKNYTKLAKILFIGFIVLAASQPFLETNYQRTIYFWNEPPVWITYFLTLLYFFLKDSNNNKIKRTYMMITLISYFVSFHYFYNESCTDNNLIALVWAKELLIVFILFAMSFLSRTLNKRSTEFKMYPMAFMTIGTITVFLYISLMIDRFTTIYWGTHLFFLSFLSFIVMNLLRQNVISKEVKETAKMIQNPIDIYDSFIYANYSSGLSDDTSIKDDLSTIINSQEKKEIIFFVHSDLSSPHRMEYSRIKKIELGLQTYDAKSHQKKITDLTKGVMMGTVLNTLTSQAAGEQFQSKLDLYVEAVPETVTLITIVYEMQNEEKTLCFYTKTDSSLFFETLEKTVSFPIERI